LTLSSESHDETPEDTGASIHPDGTPLRSRTSVVFKKTFEPDAASSKLCCGASEGRDAGRGSAYVAIAVARRKRHIDKNSRALIGFSVVAISQRPVDGLALRIRRVVFI
jgi:hypothetical protein